MKFKLLFLTLTIFVISFTFFQSKKNPSNKIKSQYKNLSKFDNPDMASYRDYVMMMDPKTGKIPFEKYPIARLASEKSANYSKSTNSLTWTQVPSDMGGRTKCLAYDPNDVSGNKVWAGSATGGLWYNPDISDSIAWVPVSDIWESLSISSICFDPNNSNIMYVGTGESETATIIYRESSGRGYGIWKSTDGGNSFTQLASTQNFAYISDIAIRDESGTSVIYVSAMSGIYQGEVFQPTPSDGLYRSDNGGASWTQVVPNIPGETDPFAISDIEISDNGTIYLGTTNNMNGLGGSCILQSTTGLTGSWTIIDEFKNALVNDTEYNITARVMLSASKSTPNTVYAIIASKDNLQLVGDFPSTQCKYLVKTTDGGANWNYSNMPNDYSDGKNWAYLAWHAFSIKVDPTDANTIYAGGLDVHRSTDGGTTWEKLSDWVQMYYGGADDYVHGDIHDIIYKNGTNEIVVASDGGVFYSADHTATTPIFKEKNQSFSSLQFYSCAITQSGDYHYSGGLQDNGTVYYDAHPFNINDMIQGGDGAFTSFDENDVNMIITSTYNNQFLVYDFATGDYEYISDVESGSFITTFDYDWQNNVIWANACNEFGTGADQVLKLYNFYSHTSEFINLGTGATVPFSSVRLVGTNTLILGTTTGEIYKVDNINSSPSSTQIDGGNLPSGFVSCIQTSANADTILVTLSNYGIESVWQSYNAGNSWTDISGNLPDMPIRWAIYHPTNKNLIMLATETGIWITENANQTNPTWVAQNTGLANVRIDMLDVRKSENLVLAASHGRCMFTTTWDIATEINTVSNINNTIKIYPNPVLNNLNIIIENEKLLNTNLLIIDMNGKVVKTINNSSARNEQISIDVSNLEPGIYYLRLGNFSKKFVKIN